MDSEKRKPRKLKVLKKTPTGIIGLDEITKGGLPRGRVSLICGGPGSGKTLLGMEFLIRGAVQYGEPGVFLSFEESGDELAANVASLGFDLKSLCASNRVVVDHAHVESSEIEETGEYDLEGLFVRLDYAIKSVGAKRVVLDTIEALFAGLSNSSLLRAELRRLFRWLKDRGMTAVVTGEKGVDGLTRHGLEEYVSDCVIFLDHRISSQMATRRVRILKYRGSFHGTNEYPFIIGSHGLEVFPITSLGLEHSVSDERLSSGIAGLDAMFGGKGYYRGSTILVSGTAGTGKTSFACKFVEAACRRGERCLYFAFEESTPQILRNMRSVGMDLKRLQESGLLKFSTHRPTAFGLEHHLVAMHRLLDEYEPKAVVIDPISNLGSVGIEDEIKSMLTRLLDYVKNKGVTSFLTSLTAAGGPQCTDVGISSLADAWLVLSDIETAGERNRGIHIVKSRGMGHSNQIREFRLSDRGIDLCDVFSGSGGVLTGAARVSHEEEESQQKRAIEQKISRLEKSLGRKRKALNLRIGEIKSDFENEAEEIAAAIEEEKHRLKTRAKHRDKMKTIRKAGGNQK